MIPIAAHYLYRALPFIPVLLEGLTIHRTLFPKKIEQDITDVCNTKLPIFESLPLQKQGEICQKELSSLLEKLHLKKSIQVRVNQTPYGFGALGSFLFSGRKYISCCPNMHFLDKNAWSFLIKHEISHLKNNDSFHYHLSGLIITVASAILFPFIMPFRISLSLSFINPIHSIIHHQYSKYRENKADEFAIENSTPEELKGGLRFFKNYQEIGKKVHDIGHWFFYSSKGDYRLDFTHPSVSSRVQKIEKELLQRNSPIQKKDLEPRYIINGVKGKVICDVNPTQRKYAKLLKKEEKLRTKVLDKVLSSNEYDKVRSIKDPKKWWKAYHDLIDETMKREREKGFFRRLLPF
ncbi:MAG: M48 family metalloprotease [Chlamydiota bacterium]